MGEEGLAPGHDLLLLLGAHFWTAPLEAVGEHGDGAEEEEETEAKAVDLAVEMPPEEWAPIEGQGGPAAMTFVDGMRRVEVGLAAWAGERPIWALAGAVAAGAVRCRPPERAQVVAEAMERVLVVGLEGCREEELVVPAGSNSLRYRVVAAGGGGQRQVAFALLGHMRSLEVQVARSLSPAPGEALVVDGPLPFRPRQLPAGDAVGLVKEHRRLYLPHPNALACLHSLRPGQRTPLFLTKRGSGRQRGASPGTPASPRASSPYMPSRASFAWRCGPMWGGRGRRALPTPSPLPCPRWHRPHTTTGGRQPTSCP